MPDDWRKAYAELKERILEMRRQLASAQVESRILRDRAAAQREQSDAARKQLEQADAKPVDFSEYRASSMLRKRAR